MILAQCIPNVSEGRRRQVIDRLAGAFGGSDDVALLHVHPDIDHNRTVLTVVGAPEALLDAAEELYARAIEAVDMRRHRGVHPRIGAVDVCPFVPLEGHGTGMAECIELARRLGERVARRFGLPVFLYREAASAPHRRDLSAIRRGQFEGLEAKLADPAWQPDFGPAAAHASGGATVIGARGPLIAFNVVLDSEDLAAARGIAARVRASSGGLPGIKAMGVVLGSRQLVQVSMNVEDPAVTPLHVAFGAVRAAAKEHGVQVLESELVGLAPLDSVAAAAADSLRLVDFGPDRILEQAIESSRHSGALRASGDRESATS